MTPRVYRSALLLKRRNAFVVSQVGWAHTAFEERQHAINRQGEWVLHFNTAGMSRGAADSQGRWLVQIGK